MAALTMRYLRALAAFVVLLVFLAGLPAGLLRLAGPPWPRPPGTRDELAAWLSQPVTRELVLWLLTLAVWLLWAWLVYSVAADITARLAAAFAPARLRRLRLAGPVHALVGGLIGAVVVGLTSGPAHANATTGPVPPPQPTGPVSPIPVQPAHLVEVNPHYPPPTDTNDHPVTTVVESPAAGSAATGRPVDLQPVTAFADGVSLPDNGGWIGPAVAEMIAATVTLLWLHRRRRYRPGPPQPAERADPDLDPPPRTAEFVLATCQHTDPPASAEVPPPAGTPLRLADLPRQLTLTGPGAADALRGLLATALLGARATGTVTITSTDLQRLLRPYPPPDSIRGLTVAHLPGREQQQPRLTLTSGLGTHVVIADGTSAIDPEDIERTVWHIATSGIASTATPSTTDSVDHMRALGRLTVLGAAPLADLLTLIQTIHTIDEGTDVAPRQPRSPVTPVPAATRTADPDSVTDHRLTIALLGPVTVTPSASTADPRTGSDPGAGQPIRFSRAAAVQLLAYLAIHRDGATTDQIRHALWPGVPTASARHRVHSTASSLRTTLRSVAGGADLIVREYDRYRLDSKHVDTDLWQFDDAINRAATSIDPNARRAALLNAVASHHAPLAATASWPWLTIAREACRRNVIDALASLAETESEPHGQLRWLQRAIQLDPINEALYQRAIRAHAAAGNTDGIRLLLDSLTRHLAEIERRPDPATVQLVDQMDTGSPAPEA